MADIFELFKKIEKKETSNEPITHIVAGLGNPDLVYQGTRHNAGYMALGYYCAKENFEITRSKFQALVGEKIVSGKRCLFMLPTTYMNNSGIAIRDAAAFYKIPPENILVIFDDISLDVGRMRIRRKGSDGGHNGIKSIIYQLSSDAFPRIKIGVGAKPDPETDLADWVLGKFPKEQKERLEEVFENVSKAIPLIVSGKLDEAANKFN